MMIDDRQRARQTTWVTAGCVVLGIAMAAAETPGSLPGAWPQWGGPDRNFVVQTAGLADAWPDDGPPVVWSRPLGLGHSALVADDTRLYTLYRPGKEISRKGPWESREVVVALDRATGRTLWEHEYPSRPENFSFGAGPHTTPLLAGRLVFTAGTNKQIHALDRESGAVVWLRDLVRDEGAPPTLARPAVKAGYGSSPIAYRDTLILQAGGAGQAVMALRQQDGSVVWRSGDFLTAEAAPILIDVDGQIQLVVVGGQTVNGLDPATGEVFWSHPHDTDGDMNNTMPVWGPDNILFVTSAYNQGSRGLRLSRRGGRTEVEEIWFTNRFRLMFSNALRLGPYVYGTSGDFGPAFLGALDVRSGEVSWQERGFGRSSLVHAGDKTIILDEDGDLALVRLSPSGLERLADTRIFGTTSWTAPTLVGTTLYARDREKVLALDLAESPR
jgi:outer membrane protein assembly factor BamB